MTELLVILVILGVLSVVGLQKDSGLRAKELQFGDSGESDLRIIFNSEKEYHVEQNAYLSAPDVSQINSNFGIFIQNPRFSYKVVSSATGFTATATRVDGNFCKGKKMTITETGTVVKGCDFW